MKKVAVFAGSRDGINPIFNKHALELGSLLAQRNLRVLWGGGQNGIMGALSNGVARKNGEMEAYIAQAYFDPNEQHPRHVVKAQACIDDNERNKIFMAADFQIALAGGVGSALEIIHALNDKIYHDTKSSPLIIISSDDFYKTLQSLLSDIVAQEFNAPSIKNRYKIVKNPIQAIDALGLY